MLLSTYRLMGTAHYPESTPSSHIRTKVSHRSAKFPSWRNSSWCICGTRYKSSLSGSRIHPSQLATIASSRQNMYGGKQERTYFCA